MNQKFDPILHAKIRELFPLEMGSTHIIEVLSCEPLKYQASTFTDPDSDEMWDMAGRLVEEDKPHFLIDTLFHTKPTFYYRDASVTLVKEYYTDKTIRFTTRDPNLVLDMEQVKKELALLADLLKEKAS